MNLTKFRQLVIGEKFNLPGSEVLMIKERLRHKPEQGWFNASYYDINQKVPCYLPDEAQVMRRRSNDPTT